MASITKQANGRREIQFIGPDQKRRTLRLGKVDQKTADSTRLRVEELNAAKIHGAAVSIFTSQWLAMLGESFHERLVRCGLCDLRVVKAVTELPLHKMLSDYIARRDDVKPRTKTIYGQAEKHLTTYFGRDRSVRSIAIAEAGDFRWEMRSKYSEAYTAKMIIKARTFWRDAVDRKFTEVNVFSKVPVGS